MPGLGMAAGGERRSPLHYYCLEIGANANYESAIGAFKAGRWSIVPGHSGEKFQVPIFVHGPVQGQLASEGLVFSFIQ